MKIYQENELYERVKKLKDKEKQSDVISYGWESTNFDEQGNYLGWNQAEKPNR